MTAISPDAKITKSISAKMRITNTSSHVLTLLKRPTKTNGIWSWFTTVDHKKIGMLYIAVSLVFFVCGGTEALLIRMQLFTPDGSVLTAVQYNQMFTMHGTTMVFLVGMPIIAGFGNYLIPLLIGARDVAFPRLNMFGFWVFAMGGTFMYSSFFLGGAPDGGWFGYTPLTSSPYDSGILPGNGTNFWAIGLLMLAVGSTTSALNFIVTVVNMRAPGMKLMRMPIFVWMMTIVSFLTVFALPVFSAALIMVFFDRNFGTTFFFSATGGDPLLYQHMFWIFGHPEVYILILPGMGIVSEILPVFSRKPLFGYSVVVFSGIAIGFVGFGVWAHHMFTTGLGPVAISAFGVSTMLVGVPTGVKIFNWLGTLWGGSLRFTVPMLYSIGFIAMFTIGGLSGVTHAVVPADTQQTDTYYIIAHFHYVLFGGLVFALLGGIVYWFPKAFGRMMNERIGKWTFWLIFIGFNLTFAPMHVTGLAGQARRTWRYQEELGVTFLNQLSTIGAFIIATAVLIFVTNMVWSKYKGKVCGSDPWDGRTLEWSIPSPTPEYNFLKTPEVHGVDSWWHEKYEEDVDGRPMLRNGVDLKAEPKRVPRQEAIEKYGVHLPSPSFWPFVIPFGMTITAFSLALHSWSVIPVGVIIIASGLIGWAIEPDSEPHKERNTSEREGTNA